MIAKIEKYKIVDRFFIVYIGHMPWYNLKANCQYIKQLKQLSLVLLALDCGPNYFPNCT